MKRPSPLKAALARLRALRPFYHLRTRLLRKRPPYCVAVETWQPREEAWRRQGELELADIADAYQMARMWASFYEQHHPGCYRIMIWHYVGGRWYEMTIWPLPTAASLPAARYIKPQRHDTGRRHRRVA